MTELSFDEIQKLVENKKIKSINVCGSPASGKSTLSKKLSDKLGYKIIDLDTIFYKGNCIRNSKEEDLLMLKQVLSVQNIIIDGTYSSSLNFRIDKIDLFILTDSKVFLCLYRFIKRILLSKNIKCGERFTWKTFNLILNYNNVWNEILKNLIPPEKVVIYKGI